MTTLQADKILTTAIRDELARNWEVWAGAPWYRLVASGKPHRKTVVGEQVWESLRDECSSARSAYLDEQESGLRGTVGDTPMHFAWGFFVLKPSEEVLHDVGAAVSDALWKHLNGLS